MKKLIIGIGIIISGFILFALLYDNNLELRNKVTWAERNEGAYSVKVETKEDRRVRIETKEKRRIEQEKRRIEQEIKRNGLIPERNKTACQGINSKGYTTEASKIANIMNREMKKFGIGYTVSTKEINTVICNFCANNPYASPNEITHHLELIVEVMRYK